LAEAQAAGKAERWWEAEIQRLKGALLLAQGDAEETEHCFEQAIRIAQHQQAKSLELRAATSLARLWGRAGEARRGARSDWRRSMIGSPEGFDTADLKDAAGAPRPAGVSARHCVDSIEKQYCCTYIIQMSAEGGGPPFPHLCSARLS